MIGCETYAILALLPHVFAFNYQSIITGSGCGIAQPFHVVQTSNLSEVNMSIPCSLITIHRKAFSMGKPIPILKDSNNDLSNSEKEALAHEGETTNQDVNEATTIQTTIQPSGIATESEESGSESGEGSSSYEGSGSTLSTPSTSSITSGSGSGSGTSATTIGSESGSGSNGAATSTPVSGSDASGTPAIGSGSGSSSSESGPGLDSGSGSMS